MSLFLESCVFSVTFAWLGILENGCAFPIKIFPCFMCECIMAQFCLFILFSAYRLIFTFCSIIQPSIRSLHRRATGKHTLWDCFNIRGLKGLSHEIYFKNVDKNLQNYRPKKGTCLDWKNCLGLQWFHNAKSVFLRLMPVCVGLIMLPAYFCQSPLIQGRVYFNIDECIKLLAASALLVQSGASLVSHNCFMNRSRPLCTLQIGVDF